MIADLGSFLQGIAVGIACVYALRLLLGRRDCGCRDRDGRL